MSWKCCGWKVLLKRKIFIPSLQTADRSSGSPACLAVSCFRAIWTLGLCGKSEGSNSGAVMQTGVTAFAQLPLLSTCKAVDKVLLCWYCVILICLRPAKGLTASVSLTPLQALWAPHYSFREENIAIQLLCPQRAELIFSCQPGYHKVRAQRAGCSLSLQVHEAYNITTIIQYVLKPFTFYLFFLR